MSDVVIEGKLDLPEATPPVMTKPEAEAEKPVAAVPASAEEPDDLATLLRRVQEAAAEWNIHQEKSEGRFVSAMLLAIGRSAQLSEAARAEFKAAFASNQVLFKAELACAREVTKAVNVSLAQARTTQIAAAVEKETLVIRMIKDTLPMFAEKLQGVLAIREKAVNERVRWRLRGWACLASLGFFLAGYGLCALSVPPPSSQSLGHCLARTIESNGHFYCDVSDLVPR